MRNGSTDHFTKIIYKLQMNTIEYMLETKLDTHETHSPRSIKNPLIQHRIPTRRVLEHEMKVNTLMSLKSMVMILTILTTIQLIKYIL